MHRYTPSRLILHLNMNKNKFEKWSLRPDVYKPFPQTWRHQDFLPITAGASSLGIESFAGRDAPPDDQGCKSPHFRFENSPEMIYLFVELQLVYWLFN